MERLFSGWTIHTPRMSKRHKSSASHFVRAWMTKAASEHLNTADNPALELLRIINDPSSYPGIQITTKAPTFFDDAEHFEVGMYYHDTDIELIKLLNTVTTECQLCKTMPAKLIDSVTTFGSGSPTATSYIMCGDCFDTFADSADI